MSVMTMMEKKIVSFDDRTDTHFKQQKGGFVSQSMKGATAKQKVMKLFMNYRFGH